MEKINVFANGDLLNEDEMTNLKNDIKNHDAGYTNIWGFVPESLLRNEHFNQNDYSIVYLKDTFDDNYIVIKDLDDHYKVQYVSFKTANGTDICDGYVVKLPLDSGLEFYKPTLIAGVFQLGNPNDIAILGDVKVFENYKSSTLQGVISVLGVNAKNHNF